MFLFLLSGLISLNALSIGLIIDINEGLDEIPFETGDVEQTMSSSFVQIIDLSKKQEFKQDLGQIIEKKSGIKIRRLGGLGSYSTVSIRGKSSDQVMIYLDGMLMNNASGGRVDLSQIPLNQIARIEIYKDVIPAEFSEVANGGVINLITHRAKNKKTTRVTMGLGSFDTLSLDVNNMGFYQNWQFSFSGGYLKSENDFSFLHENNTPDNPYDDEIKNRQNNQLTQYNVMAKAKYDLSNVESVQYQAELFHKKKQIPAINNSAKTTAFLAYDNAHFSANYLNDNVGKTNVSLKISTKIGLKETVFDDKKKQIGLNQSLVRQTIKSWSNNFYLKSSHTHFQWVNNSSFRYEALSINDEFKASSQRENNRSTFSNALQVNLYFHEKKLIISPAGRFFFSRDQFDGNTLTESEASRKQYYTLTPQIGVRYQWSGNTSLKFNAGQYYRLPNYVELFGTQGFIGSNETLKPEKGLNFDAGFEHLQYPKSERLTKLQWNASFFHSIINNEIAYFFDARGVGKPQNNRRSVISGIENNWLVEINYAIEFTSNTTFQLPLNRSDPNKTKLLGGRSLWSQVSRIAWNENALYLFFEHEWTSAYYFDNEQRLLGKARSIFNSGIKHQSKKLDLIMTLNNIFNHKNKDYFSQVSPGFSIFVSATVKF